MVVDAIGNTVNAVVSLTVVLNNVSMVDEKSGREGLGDGVSREEEIGNTTNEVDETITVVLTKVSMADETGGADGVGDGVRGNEGITNELVDNVATVSKDGIVMAEAIVIDANNVVSLLTEKDENEGVTVGVCLITGVDEGTDKTIDSVDDIATDVDNDGRAVIGVTDVIVVIDLIDVGVKTDEITIVGRGVEKVAIREVTNNV